MSVVKKTNINPDLDKERQKCTFNTVEFTNWWYGGVKEVEKKRWQGNFIEYTVLVNTTQIIISNN